MLCPTMAPAAQQRGRQLVIFWYFVVFYPTEQAHVSFSPNLLYPCPQLRRYKRRHQALQPDVSRALGRSVHAL